MTDTTDIAALREQAESMVNLLENLAGYEPQDIDMDAVELRFEDENGFDTGCDISIVDTAQQSADVIRALLDQLEAERQRADDAHKYGSERDSENESLMLTVGRLRVEIAELKGDQKPYGYYSAETETILEQQGHASISAEPLADSRFPLFTAPQKPVVTLPALPTTPIVPTQPFSLHDIMRATRNMDIKAIEAAGGIVSTSDQRLMQDMSGIVQDGE